MHAEANINDVRSHFLEALSNAVVRDEPYQHTYVRDIFPPYYYDMILAELPEDEAYTDRTYENRIMAKVNDLGPFWKDLHKWLFNCSWDVMHLFEATLSKRKSQKFSADVRLVRDKMEYKIKPHTDIKSKAVSLLFYLADDDTKSPIGTSIMVPKTKGFTSDGNSRYPFEDFEKHFTAPFLPNTMFGFPRSEISFHGVEPISVQQRDVLLLNIYGHAS